MKSLLLAATVAAGLICSAGNADAQYRYRRASSYSYASPTYSYPTYSYATPTYYGSSVVTSGYAPVVTSGGVVTSSYYTPGSTIYSTGYSTGSYYDPYVGNSGYYGSTYPNYSGSNYYGSSYYGGYPASNGIYISPSGVNVGGRPAWRW